MTVQDLSKAYYWLSFCDPGKPKGQQFLGACIVEANSMWTAVPTAGLMGCNPGGEVEIIELPELPPDKLALVREHMNKLLSFDEMVALGWEPVRISDLPE